MTARSMLAVALVVACLVAGGCSDDGSPDMAVGDQPSTSASSENSLSEVPTSTGEVVRSGDADTNPACALLEVSEAEAAAGSHVTEVNGTETPGQHAASSHNCFWIPDPSEDAPTVSIQLETDLGSERDAAVADLRDQIDLGIGSEIVGIGDVAVSGPSLSRAVVGDDLVAVQVTNLGGGATPADAGDASVDLLAHVASSIGG